MNLETAEEKKGFRGRNGIETRGGKIISIKPNLGDREGLQEKWKVRLEGAL